MACYICWVSPVCVENTKPTCFDCRFSFWEYLSCTITTQLMSPVPVVPLDDPQTSLWTEDVCVLCVFTCMRLWALSRGMVSGFCCFSSSSCRGSVSWCSRKRSCSTMSGWTDKGRRQSLVTVQHCKARPLCASIMWCCSGFSFVRKVEKLREVEFFQFPSEFTGFTVKCQILNLLQETIK